MQQFHKFITLRLCFAQHVSDVCTFINSLWFYRWNVVVAVLLVVVWPDPD
jgi:hypothetical protein